MNKIKGYLTTSSAEALAVGEQTYNVEVDGNAIITSLETDKRSRSVPEAYRSTLHLS